MLEFGVDRKACAGCRALLQFYFKTGFLIGGRITVMVDPSLEGNMGGRVIASALWMPPHKTGRLEYSYHDQSGYYPCSEMLEVNWLAGAYSYVLICLKFLVLLETPLRDFFWNLAQG